MAAVVCGSLPAAKHAPGRHDLGRTIMALGDYADVCRDSGVDRMGAAGRHDQSQHQFPAQAGPRDLLAECRLLKLGKRLAVGEVDDPGRRSSMTWSRT